MTGRSAGQAGGLESCDGGQADAGRQQDVVGVEAVAVRQDEDGPGFDGADRRLDEGDARPPAGLDQRTQQGSVVDVMVAGHLDPAPERRAQGRHQPARHSEALRRWAVRPSECW